MMNFKKHEIVTLIDPKDGDGNRQYGFITISTEKSLKVLFAKQKEKLWGYSAKPDQVEMMLTQLDLKKGDFTLADVDKDDPVLAEEIRAITAPAPKKGDCVAFENEGVRCTGRVLAGGKNPQVSLGENRVLSGDKSLFRVIDEPEHPDPEIAHYRVINFRETAGHDDSLPYQADITCNGKKVIKASNDGWGGPDLFQELQKGSMDDLRRTLQDYIGCGDSLGLEFSDLWVHWDWTIRPTGISFKHYMNEFLESVRNVKAQKRDEQSV